MVKLIKITFKLFAKQFYEVNLRFFLFWFIFLFGIISPEQIIPYHVMLIKSEISSYPVLAGVMIAWLLYNQKCIRFIEGIIVTYHNSFLHVMQSMSVVNLMLIWGICHIFVFLPVLVYALIVVLMAIKQSAFIVVILILSFLVLLNIYSAFRLRIFLLKPIDIQRQSFYNKLLGRNKIVNYKFYLVHYILMDRKLDLLALKIFSSILFYLFFIELREDFDKSWFNFTLLLIGFGHSLMMFGVHRFMEEKLTFLKSLPVPLLTRATMFLIPICLIFTPELLIMLVNGSGVLSIQDIFISFFVLVAQLFVFTSILYLKNISMKEYIKFMFIIIILYVFIYNSIDNKLLIIVPEFALCYFIFKYRYLKYKHIIYNT